jgi:hypothetical protein
MIRERSFLWKWFFIELFVQYIVHSKEIVYIHLQKQLQMQLALQFYLYIEMAHKVQPFLNMNF